MLVLYMAIIALLCVVITLGILCYRQSKRLKRLDHLRSLPLNEKILGLIEDNYDDFGDMAWDGVQVVFNPSTESAMLSNVDCIEENVHDFFNDIAEELIAQEQENASGV